MVIRALKTTTQLALPTLSISVSTIWGTFTLVWSWVAWIRSGKKLAGWNFSKGAEQKLSKQEDRWGGKNRGVMVQMWCCQVRALLHGSICSSERASSTWKITAASDSASDYMSPTFTQTQRSCFFYSELLLEAAIFHLQMYADEHTHVYTLCHGCLL